MDASERRRRASEEAASWWLRLQCKEVTKAEREEFVYWLRESVVHVAEMLRIAKVHDALKQFGGWAESAGLGIMEDEHRQNVVLMPLQPDRDGLQRPPSDEPQAPRSSRKRLNRFMFAAAAAGLAATVLGVLLLSPFWRQQTIQTQRGERREVSLADGSVVDVDPQTRLLIVFEEHTRRVVLKQGRALFRVAKNPQRPFLVDADGSTIRAIGTAFGVERQAQRVVVTVAEGKVGVFASDATASQLTESAAPAGVDPSSSEGARAGRSAVYLTAGQQVAVSRSGVAASVHKVDSDRELAWARGQLVLDNETVAAAVAEFNRYNRLQMHVLNEDVARRSVSGVFNASDPESFVGFLQTVTVVRVTRSDSEIIVR